MSNYRQLMESYTEQGLYGGTPTWNPKTGQYDQAQPGAQSSIQANEDYLRELRNKLSTAQLFAYNDLSKKDDEASEHYAKMMGYYDEATDFSSITKNWEENYANPAMQSWWKNMAPGIRDEFAGIPGGLYSKDRASGVVGEAGKYWNTLGTSLFTALENARTNASNLKGQMFGTLGGLSESSPQGMSSMFDTASKYAAVGSQIGPGQSQLPFLQVAQSGLNPSGEGAQRDFWSQGGSGIIGTIIGAFAKNKTDKTENDAW